MSKNFICKGCGETFEKNMESTTPNYCYICNEFYMLKKIAVLEHRLSNCIETKFKIWQEVWFIDPENDVSSGEVWKIEINCVQTRYTVFWGNDYEDIYFEYELFATEEEAKAKLEELQDGR